MHGVGDQSGSNVLTNIVAVRINYYCWGLSKKNHPRKCTKDVLCSRGSVGHECNNLTIDDNVRLSI